MNAPATETLSVKDLLKQCEQGLDVSFSTNPPVACERRLIFDHLVEPPASTIRQRFEAIASALRDLLAQRWLLTSKPTIMKIRSKCIICRWSSCSDGRSAII